MTVEELLIEEGIQFKQSPADYVIRCLNPEHDDHNPSMRIDKITGVFNCFSCGFKGNIFKHFDKPSNKMDIKRERLKQTIDRKRSESIGLQIPREIVPYVGNERNIKPETYKQFEAFISPVAPFTGRIVFPIRDITASFDYEEKYKLGIATIHKTNNLDNEKFETIKSINKVSLDEYNFEHQIGFLKIDVEGHELDILRGAKKFITRNMPTMLIEIEERHSGVQPNIAINEIEQLGYKCFFVDDNFSLQRIQNPNELKNNNFVFIPNKKN